MRYDIGSSSGDFTQVYTLLTGTRVTNALVLFGGDSQDPDHWDEIKKIHQRRLPSF